MHIFWQIYISFCDKIKRIFTDILGDKSITSGCQFWEFTTKRGTPSYISAARNSRCMSFLWMRYRNNVWHSQQTSILAKASNDFLLVRQFTFGIVFVEGKLKRHLWIRYQKFQLNFLPRSFSVIEERNSFSALLKATWILKMMCTCMIIKWCTFFKLKFHLVSIIT